MAKHILLVSTDTELARMLELLSMRVSTTTVSDSEGWADPTARQPDVIMLDLRGETELPELVEVQKGTHPTTPVVILATRLDPTMMLNAMRVGVAEFVTMPVAASDLQASQSDLKEAIDRVTARTITTDVTGEVYAFVGSKGGIGTTTTAVNVATALAAKEPSTLFIDLHLSYGDAAEFFAVQPKFSIVDALENTHRLDGSVFGGLVARAKSGVDVLGASGRSVVPADGDRVRSVLRFALGHYRYTVLDVPRSDGTILDALEDASRIILVANQELTSVKTAGRLYSMLRRRYGASKLMVALARYDASAEIGKRDVERTLGTHVTHVLPSAYQLALQALNSGRPLLLENHSKLATSYQNLAQDLVGPEAPALTNGSSGTSGFLGKLTAWRA